LGPEKEKGLNCPLKIMHSSGALYKCIIKLVMNNMLLRSMCPMENAPEEHIISKTTDTNILELQRSELLILHEHQ